MSYTSDLDQLKGSAERQGWRVSKTTRGHWQFYAPNKHDIITFAGTPGDVRGFTNSLSQMKKAGYVDYNDSKQPVATLADLFPTKVVEPSVVKEPKPMYRGAISDTIREYMRNHMDKPVPVDDVVNYVMARYPQIPERMNVVVAIAPLIRQGTFDRMSMGMYIMRSKEPITPLAPPAPSPPPAPTPEPVMVQAEAVAPTPVSDDSDIAELDAALVALAKIESVVRRNREVLKQFKALKVMLNNMGSAV